MFKTLLPASLTTAKASGRILSSAAFSSALSFLKSEENSLFFKISLNSSVFARSSSSERAAISGSNAFIWSTIGFTLLTFFSLGLPKSDSNISVIFIIIPQV